jgi:DNA-binding transcriptional LysR family regulator
VATALSHVSAATRELRSAKGDPVLTLAADQSIAHMWLMPRLAAFRSVWPGLRINLVVSDEDAACLAPQVDIALIHGEGDWPGHEATLLFGEEVFPVCSPDYRGNWPDIGALQHDVLLDLDDDHWNWMNWRQWLNAQGVGAAVAPRRLTINNYPLLIDAARRGLGVALGWRGLVDDDLAAGRLVTPLRASLKTHFGYHAVWPRDRPRSPAVFALIDAMRGRSG